MESFHEKQEGSLCAQHCLNNLLQGEYFNEEERMRIAEGRVTSEEYLTGLELILFNSLEYQRKLGKQWFNLNSLLMGPELTSDTYLALFLAQLQQQDCKADQLLQMIRVQQMQRPKLIGEELAQLKEQKEDLQRALALSCQEMDMEDEEADLHRAIQLNIPQTSGTHLTLEELWKRRKQQQDPPGQFSHPCERPTTNVMSEEDMLQAAVTMSLETVRNSFKTEGKNNTFYKSFRCSYFPTLLSMWL
ncbi:unnamed protein product [Nyctereutes procyonoides]|uniref:ubiquitinyl hydrolase 1 n=1 Tax=Nyctereutes procyonoides TaxID=34880 RepID=A0A811ZY24_NYCPR|nr:unnamed protein product [Nyctereutes procyonoides]